MAFLLLMVAEQITVLREINVIIPLGMKSLVHLKKTR